MSREPRAWVNGRWQHFILPPNPNRDIDLFAKMFMEKTGRKCEVVRDKPPEQNDVV